jgi:hypothetical protein
MFYAAHRDHFVLSHPEAEAGAKKAGVLRCIVSCFLPIAPGAGRTSGRLSHRAVGRASKG